MRALVIASIFAASAAAAQPAPPAPPANAAGMGNSATGMADARARMMAADANKDGKWDKAEWVAAGRREMGFVFMDADKDGFVTPDELKSGMARMQARRSAS
jgi:hypothetical protein